MSEQSPRAPEILADPFANAVGFNYINDGMSATLEQDLPSVSERNQWLDSKLNDDPAQPLPVVSLNKVENPRSVVSFDDEPVDGGSVPRLPESEDSRITMIGSYDIAAANGSRVGYAVLNKSKLEPRAKAEYYIGDIKILDQNRGKGYGPAAYLAVLKSLPAGEGLRTEGVLSPDAKRIWEAMVAEGVAKRIGKPDEAMVMYETTF